jgi:flagellar hook-length control protein FliK
VADAIAGAHARSSKSSKGGFADVLASILSAQPTTVQDNAPAQNPAAQVTDALNASTAANGDATDGTADAISALAAKVADIKNSAVTTDANHKHAAFAMVRDTLNASTTANSDTSEGSADAISALASKVADIKNSTAATDPHHRHAAFAMVRDSLNASTTAQDDASDDSADAVSALAAKITGMDATADTSATPPAATAPSAQQDTSKRVHTGARHATLTAATQARLVSALTQAATAPAKIVGSDGKTKASSDSNGTPADAQTPQSAQPAQSQTPADTSNVLAAMQTAQAVVTTVTANADKTEATVTPRTMTQLEKAAMSNTAQQALHSAAPAAKTEAQALTMPADAKSAHMNDSGGSQTGSGQKQSHEGDGARLAANAKAPEQQSPSTTVPDAPQPTTAAAAPVAQTTSTDAAISNAASAIGDSGTSQAVPPTTIATTLQVAQQTAASSAAPDLAALGVSIAAKSKDGQNEFNIRMDPADLGRVDVRLSVDAAGKAQAHLIAEKPETLALLQRDSHTLASTLKDSGLDLSNNGLNFSLKGEQQSSTPTFVARNRALSIASVQTTDTVSSTSGTSTAPGDSRLDIRV